jgi:hypothetical protein
MHRIGLNQTGNIEPKSFYTRQHIFPTNPIPLPTPISCDAQARLCGPPKLLLDVLQIFRGIDLDDPTHFRCVPHQLFGTGIQHAELVVAGYGEVVEEHVGYGEAARGLLADTYSLVYSLFFILWRVRTALGVIIPALRGSSGGCIGASDRAVRLRGFGCWCRSRRRPGRSRGSSYRSGLHRIDGENLASACFMLWERTDGSLGIFGARRAQAEFAQLLLGLFGEGE